MGAGDALHRLDRPPAREPPGRRRDDGVWERLLHGATVADLGSLWGSDQLGTDPVDARRRSVADERATFAEPGALERTVHHPAGDMPGAMLLGLRTTDNLLHAWDLARAVGGDEALDPDLVTLVWSRLEPTGPGRADPRRLRHRAERDRRRRRPAPGAPPRPQRPPALDPEPGVSQPGATLAA